MYMYTYTYSYDLPMNMPSAHFSGSAFVIPEHPQALERRFQPVSVPEPTNEEAVQILRGIARKYEATSIPERMDEGWLQYATDFSASESDIYRHFT